MNCLKILWEFIPLLKKIDIRAMVQPDYNRIFIQIARKITMKVKEKQINNDCDLVRPILSGDTLPTT